MKSVPAPAPPNTVAIPVTAARQWAVVLEKNGRPLGTGLIYRFVFVDSLTILKNSKKIQRRRREVPGARGRGDRDVRDIVFP